MAWTERYRGLRVEQLRAMSVDDLAERVATFEEQYADRVMEANRIGREVERLRELFARTADQLRGASDELAKTVLWMESVKPREG